MEYVMNEPLAAAVGDKVEFSYYCGGNTETGEVTDVIEISGGYSYQITMPDGWCCYRRGQNFTVVPNVIGGVPDVW